MTSVALTTAREVLQELTDMEAVVEDAVCLVNDGRQIDLGVLGNRINMICDAAVALTSDQSRALLPVMEQLIKALGGLTARLNTTFGHLPKLQSDAAPHAAATAYGRGDSQDR